MQKTPYKNPKKILAQMWRTYKRKISATCCFATRYADLGGERGIRTAGGVTLNGFQDRRYRPLSHLSNVKFVSCFVLTCAKVVTFADICKF